MNVRPVFRDLTLVGLAVFAGWWAHGADRPVLAQHSTSSSSARTSSATDASLAFQFNGSGPDATLAVYNPINRTIYVYPRIGAGNSSVDCGYSFAVANPGAPIHRENCQPGELNPQH